MRFLIDASADGRLASYLISLGFDVRIIGRDYPRTLDDVDVLAIAHRAGRILITNDRDFARLVFEEARPHAGVILLRLKASPIAIRMTRLDYVLSAHADDLGRFIVVTASAVRVR
jgi:predicted nuclease of predicted toxin-antitoxin system